MKRLIILTIALIIQTSVVSFQLSEVHAQSLDQTTNKAINSLINVSPIIIDTNLEKGKTQTYQIKIKNLLNVPLGISAHIEDFSPPDPSQVDPNPPPQSPMISWSQLSDNSFILQENQEKTITLEIKTPADIKEGGYYETVFFTPFYSTQKQKDQPTVLSKIGALVFATYGNPNYNDLKNKVTIENLQTQLIYQKSPITFSFAVKNSYFNHFTAKPSLTVSPLLGKNQTHELLDKRILPAKTRTWKETISLNPTMLPLYKGHLAISVGQGNYIYKDIYFAVLPIKQIMLAILVASVLIVLKFGRKRIRAALDSLLRNN
ncbi:hypothetical protein HY024_01055 [Candidatus Curtissbacteria bacterium]|nr:hypothetical protein [Candidatus Curtissbacteria bacterium]